MKIFSLFSRKQEGNEQLIPEVAENAQVQDNDEDSQNENEDEKKRMITITWGTGMPIDVIFNFINLIRPQKYVKRFICTSIFHNLPHLFSHIISRIGK